MSKVLVTEQHLNDIADAIRSKNGAETLYRPGDMAAAIEAIPQYTDTSDATVIASDVLNGDIFYNADGRGVGTMPDNGAVAGVIDADNPSYTVPEGYHDGSGTVDADIATPEEVAAYLGIFRDLTTKTVTENGTYDALSDAANGYSRVTVNVESRLYTNATMPVKITDVSGYTKLYDSTIKFGNYGAKVSAALDITSEATLNANMNNGWNGTGSSYYDAENINGAYGGYDFGQAVNLLMARFWIGRYSGQNKTLYVEVQYLDGEGDWHDVQTLEVTTGLNYPLNVFDVYFTGVNDDIYGVRWVHRDEPVKSSNNNITFFGMTLYAGSNTPVYIPGTTGLIEPPTGYDGFGPLYIWE